MDESNYPPVQNFSKPSLPDKTNGLSQKSDQPMDGVEKNQDALAEEVYKQTLHRVVHYTPDWVKKDPSFNIN